MSLVIDEPPTGSSAAPGAYCSGGAGIIDHVSGHGALGANAVYVKIYAENDSPPGQPPAGTQSAAPAGDGTWNVPSVPAHTCSTTNTKQKIRAWAERFQMGQTTYDTADKDVWIQR